MRLTEDKIRRLAERLHDGLEQRGLLAYKDARRRQTRHWARAARQSDLRLHRRRSAKGGGDRRRGRAHPGDLLA